MKTYALDSISSTEQARVALCAALPGQSAPWLLLAPAGDAIAYFNIVDGDVELAGPAITADISGRHYNEDQAVVAVLTELQKEVGGVIKSDAEPHATTPGQVEVFGTFNKHLGPRFISAGVGVQFHYNQQPGVHFKTDVPGEYREAILKGLQDAMAVRFPSFPQSGSIWITRVEVHEVSSSWIAFYHAARMVVEQAFSLTQPVEA